MKNTRITLKNIKYSEALSDETYAFVADVYFDGKPVAIAENQGYGGPTNILVRTPKNQSLYNEAWDYAAALGKATNDFGGHSYVYDQNLESVVDDLFEEWLVKKELKRVAKKLAKEQEYGILYGDKDASTTGEYQVIQFKRDGKIIPLKDIMNSKMRRETIQGLVNKKIKEGFVVYNTNLPFKF